MESKKIKGFFVVMLIFFGAACAKHAFYQSSQKAHFRAMEALFSLNLPDAQGRPVGLEQWRGKPLVVNFWATWCGPCRNEMPLLNAVSRRYAPRGVVFVGIGIDSAKAIKAYSAQNPSFYPLLVGGSKLLGLMQELGDTSQAIPFTVVVDTQGEIYRIYEGELDEAELDDLLAKLTNEQ